MEEIIKVISGVMSLISILMTILMPILKLFNLTNKVIGIESYGARVKASLKVSFEFIIFFIIITMFLGNYNQLTAEIKKYIPNSLQNIKNLGTMYMFVSVIILIISITAYIRIKVKKIAKDMDKYEKNFIFENIRVGLYTFAGFLSIGIAINYQEIGVSIACSIFLLILGLYIFVLFRYEADRALLFYYSKGKKIYVYRAIDNDNFLCGTEKNALSCKYYVIKNKSNVLKRELYVVDNEEIKKDGIKNINNGRWRRLVIKIFNRYNNVVNILTLISTIIVSSIFYTKGKTHLADLFIGIVIICILVIVELCIIWCLKRIFVIIKKFLLWMLNTIVANKEIAIVVTSFLIIAFRICLYNNIFIIEWIVYFLILSLGVKAIIYKCADYMKNKSKRD